MNHPHEYRYDFAISYAAEDQNLAEFIHLAATENGRNGFIESRSLDHVGRPRPIFLPEVFADQSRFVIVLLSTSYVDRAWPQAELQSALMTAIERKGQRYIIPVQVDDIRSQEVPALLRSIGAIDGRGLRRDQIVDRIRAVLNDEDLLDQGSASNEELDPPIPGLHLFPKHARPTDSLALLQFNISPDEVDNCFATWVDGLRFVRNDFKNGVRIRARKAVFLPYWVGTATYRVRYQGWRILHSDDQQPEQAKQSVSGTIPKEFRFEQPAFIPQNEIGDDAATWLDSIKSGWDFDHRVAATEELMQGIPMIGDTVTREEAAKEEYEPLPADIDSALDRKVGGVSRHVEWDLEFEVNHAARRLAPAWIIDWEYEGRQGRSIINGRSGAGAGERITSAWKVFVLVMTIIAAIAILLTLISAYGSDHSDTPSDDAEITSEAASDSP